MAGMARGSLPSGAHLARGLLCGLVAVTLTTLLAACGSTSAGQSSLTPSPTPTPAVFGTPGPAGSPTLLTYTGHSAGAIAIAWSPDGTRVASASDDGTVQVWDPSTGVQYWSRVIDDYAFAVAWSPDGKYVAGGGRHGTVMILDSRSGRSVATYQGPANFIEGVAWSPDGTRLATAGSDGTVRVWEAATCHLALTYRGQGEPVWAVAWSPDGTRIASGTGAAGENGPVKVHNSVKVWNAQTGQTLLTYAPDAGEYYAVSWSPDGKYLATGGDDHTVTLFASATGRTIQVYKGHADVVWTAAWSPDGTKMASGGQDGSAQVWKPAVD
jgi:WD40 repeat protein